MSESYKIDVIELDLAISSQGAIAEAQKIFSPNEVRKRGKYAADPVTFIGIIATITIADLAKEAIVSLIVDGVKAGAVKVREFLKSPPLENVSAPVLATHTMKAEGIMWEIRYDPGKELSPYLRGLIVNCVDIRDLPDDTYRISINLIEGYAKAFDEQKQFICDLPFDLKAEKQ